MLGFIITIVVGALVGWLASIIAKTNAQMGCIWNIVIGVAGAALGHWLASILFNAEFDNFSIVGLLVGIGGAVLLIAVLKMLGIMKG